MLILQAFADAFCCGDVPMDTFMSEYIKKRTDAYMKRAKLEKCTDLLRQGSTSTSSSVSNSVPYPASDPSPKPQASSPGYGAGAGYGSAPYPQYGSGFGMPTPSYQR